jgi:hypothetical protein
LNLGVALVTPCATPLTAFHLSSLTIKVWIKLTLYLVCLDCQLTKEDVELLIEYMLVMKPLAAVVDIFQSEKECFLGLGVVLPLLSKLKKQLKQRVFPNLGAIRDRIISSIDLR